MYDMDCFELVWYWLLCFSVFSLGNLHRTLAEAIWWCWRRVCRARLRRRNRLAYRRVLLLIEQREAGT